MALLRLNGVGKQLRRYGNDRPKRIREFLSRPRSGGRRVERFWAVRNVSFEVQPGEMLGIIGRNGAGKSTLLRLCSEVLQPDEGRVHRTGRAEAFLDYTAGLQPDLTCRDNALLGLLISGHTRHEAKSCLGDVLEFADLAEHMSSPVRVLSTGMKLRLGFSIATQRRPDVLLLDEVVAVGDAVFQERSSARIAAFQKAGTAVVLVSHDLSLIKRSCEYAAWLRDGEMEQYGESTSVADAYLAFDDGAEAATAKPRTIALREKRLLSVQCEVNGMSGEAAIESGSPVSLKLVVTANRPFGPVIPALALVDGSGQLQCYVHSPTVVDDRSAKIGITVTLTHFALPNGEYDLSLYMHEQDWKSTLAEKARIARIVVRHAPSGAGAVRPRHDWQVLDLA